jgi:glucose/arabinose dehydrogenase/subtilisin-like proprotein convertase family protein
MRSNSKTFFGVAVLLAALGTTSAAQAQTTVSIDQAPATVQPGETFEVVWTINTPNPVLLTTVVWGDRARAWSKIGSIRSGAAGTFRTMLTAPAAPGAMHWVVYVRADPVRGVTSERVIQVTNTPTPTPTAPAAPSNMVADATSQTSVDLQWTDNSNNETGFVVQRSTAGAAFQTIAQLGANTTTYTDGSVVASTTYSYRVNARNNAGASGNSNLASVTTPAVVPVPTRPASASALTATVAGANQVDLSWTDNANNETAFLIGRRTGTSGNYAQIDQVGANVTTYSDTGVQPGTSYQYSVFATNAVGNAGGSNVATANVPAASGTVTATRNENPALAIPDNDAQGATSRLNVTGAGSIQSMQITVDIRHTWRGDLVLQLTSPAGTAITLFDVNDNDDGDNVQGTFPTTLVPNESLSNFNGEEVNGVWSLRVYDTQGQDLGDIRSWTLTAAVGSSTAPQFGLTRRVPVTGLTFPITGAAPPTSLQRVRAFPNLSFNQPVFLTHAGDGTDRVFVVEKRGVIKVFANNDAVTSAATFLDIRGPVSAGGENGLLGLAFDPNFAQNQKFYVNYTSNSGTVIARYRAVAGTNRADPNSAQVILRITQPYGNHNGGMIAFGPDNMLYIGMGDGGSGGDPQGHAQNRRDLLGAMLRINPNNSTTYTIPSDNPFVNTGGGVRGEIWAYGLRNPWRFSFDRTSGALWAGDVGQNAVEEIDIIERGGNYGWNHREGNRNYNGGGPAGMKEPTYAYAQTLGRSVIGGYVYHGSRVPGLQGIYVYGDYTSGRIWSLKYRNGQVEFNREVTSVNQLCAFGEDEAGELYAVSHGGNLYKFSPNGGTTTTFPDRLSATGLFQSVASMTAAPGVIEYDVSFR